MLPLILAASLASSPGNFSLFCNEKKIQEQYQKYYLTTMVGMVLLASGFLMMSGTDNKFGGGFSVAMGAPMVGLGFVGAMNIWEW